MITAGLINNGILGKTDINAKIFKNNTITIDMFGNVFYRQFDYKMVTHARVFSLTPKFSINEKQGLFFVNSLYYLSKKFGFDNMCSWEKIKDDIIQLPVKNNEIDFDFMESFVAELEAQRIAELEAYLKASGLDNYELSSEEQNAIEKYENISTHTMKFKDIFNKIKQGKRLKKDDQIDGDLPFVMSGVTNNGVVGYISNPIIIFPPNSITVDIFGNVFYRNYKYGAGDDTGVYWNDELNYSENSMLYFSSCMSKALLGKFSYGKKLRSSQSYDIEMILPVEGDEINISFMNTLISAIKKYLQQKR